MKTKPNDLISLYAMHVLGMLPPSEIRRFAVDHLEDPVDEELLAVSLCDKTDEFCIIDAGERLFAKHKLEKIRIVDVLRIFVRHVCRSILVGDVALQVGAELIVVARQKANLNDFHELDPFVCALSEMDDRPNDRAFFENALISEAARWAQWKHGDIDHNPSRPGAQYIIRSGG